MSNEKYRSHVFMLLLYPDNEAHRNALHILEQNYNQYAGIKHDRDYFTEDVFYTADDEKLNPEHKEGTLKYKKGDLKKEHYHIVVRPSTSKNATWNSALCSALGIETKFCESVKNVDNALMYLIHYNDTDKADYSVDEVFGPMKTKLVEILNKVEKSEGEKVVELLDFIRNYDGRLSITDFAHYCAKNGYWAEFRRSGAIFCKIIDEHNFVSQEQNWIEKTKDLVEENEQN